MKIENQCCTLEQAKKLKELGVVQRRSGFIWVGNGRKNWLEFHQGQNGLAVAYNVAELGVMLPDSLPIEDGNNWSWYHRHNWKGESVGYSAYGAKSIEQAWFTTEAEARAAMLIHLLETGKITAEQVNNRLSNA